MEAQIWRKDGLDCSFIKLQVPNKKDLQRLGRRACAILESQDPKHWAKAGGPHLLPQVIRGALILKHLGDQDGELMIADMSAHLAFVTCCALVTIGPRRIERSLFPILNETIRLMAYCARVEISLSRLPELSALPNALQINAVILCLYRDFEMSKPTEVSLAEALMLFRLFDHANSASEERDQLFRATERLQQALARLKEIMKI